MIVSEVMTPKPLAVKANETIKRAQELMVENSIRHLPVVEGHELLGIITESDIRGAFLDERSNKKVRVLDPSKMKISDYMTHNPMVVFPETHVEDAALVIYKNKIGALPVVRRNRLVGIISIMDILGIFVDLMGILSSSSRIDVIMGKDPKNFEKVSGILNKENMNIISVGMSPYEKDPKKQVYFFRVDLCETKNVVKKIEKAGFKVLSAID